MVDSARIKDFWNSWQQQPSAAEEFERFRNRMLEVAKGIWELHFRNYDARRREYALVSGTPCDFHEYFSRSGLNSSLSNAKNTGAVLFAMQCLLWTVERVAPQELDSCCRKLQQAIELSPTIMVRLARHGSTATLYPAGARLLDEAVIESNLAWLGRYPEVAKPFEAALKLYMTKDPNQYRGVLDGLRFSLEQMLHGVLKNEKPLEKQKPEFLAWLKAHDAHTHIGNMYHELLFDHFVRYQNAAVKHEEDSYTPAEVEFMLYATGTFLRFIQRLIEQENAVKATSPTR